MGENSAQSDKLWSFDFLATCLASLAAIATSHLLLPVLPLLVLYLGGDEAHIGWVVGSYGTAMLLTRPWAGKWSERLGPARMMRLTSAAFMVAVLFYNVAGAVWILALTRAMHGVAHGAYVTSSNSLIAYIAPARRRGEALGTFLVFGNLSMAIAPAIGLWAALSLGYSNLFVAISLVALALLIATQMVDRGNRYVANEKTEGKLFNSAGIVLAVVGTTAYFTYGAVASYLSPYVIERGLGNPGLFFTAFAIGGVAVRVLGGRQLDRFGRVTLIVPSTLAICLSMLWLLLASEGWSIIGAGAAYGVGSGVLYPVLMAYSIDLAGPNERASAVSTILASSDLGLALGALASGLVVNYLPLQAVWVVAGAVALLGLVAFVVLMRYQRPTLVKVANQQN